MTATAPGARTAARPAQASGGPTIVVQQVSKFYGDVVAVSDVSFSLDPGVTALLGPNGAGKSTMLEMLTGLLQPSAGRIEILGRPVRGDPQLYRQVGLVPEQEHMYPFLTGREFLRLNAVLQNVTDPDAAAARVLAIVELEDDADRKLGGYSKGMRQRAKIAAALVHEPQVLLMDEPLSGTDPLQRMRVIELINRLGAEGRTVLVSSHVLDEVERFADRILVIVNGKLAAAGNFHTIRDRMDEQASQIRVRASDPRRFAAALIRELCVQGVVISGADSERPWIRVEAADVRRFYGSIARLAQQEDVTLYEVTALDDSLASVFAYVVGR
jgi:ABC-2 type transport system ATP-binding protein